MQRQQSQPSAQQVDASSRFVEVGTVRPDPRGRLTLAKTKGGTSKAPKVDAYKQYVNDDGDIMLVPVVEVPIREIWLHRNPTVAEAFERSVEQAERGELFRVDLSDLPED